MDILLINKYLSTTTKKGYPRAVIPLCSQTYESNILPSKTSECEWDIMLSL